eukprot:11250752-Alexandrium_andersonii.AAC.1
MRFGNLRRLAAPWRSNVVPDSTLAFIEGKSGQQHSKYQRVNLRCAVVEGLISLPLQACGSEGAILYDPCVCGKWAKIRCVVAAAYEDMKG